MRTITFSDADLRAIAHDRDHHPDPRVQRKMEVLWLKSHGLPHDGIAASAGVSRRTVPRYLCDYRTGGLDHLRRGRGHQPSSTIDQSLDGVTTTYRKGMESLMAHHFQTFDDVPLLTA